MAQRKIAEKCHEEIGLGEDNTTKGKEHGDGEPVNIDVDEYIPTPPDGGWGWVIVIASFMNHFILDGICYAFGSFMLSYSTYFNSSAAETSALMSSLIGCYMLSAPVASALINKFGCRPVGIAGSLLASAAFILCTFSSTIEVMIFTFGILGGLGFGLMYMPAVVSVSLYFERKRSIAVGIGMCGTGAGTFTFGPISKLLLEHMDWKSAHYILAGVILNGAVFSALIRPLLSKHDIEQRKIKQKNITADKKPALANVEAKEQKLHSSIQTKEPSRISVSQSNLRSTQKIHVSLCRSMNKLVSQQVTDAPIEDVLDDLKRPLYRKDIFYSGSVYHLPEFKEHEENVQQFVVSITDLPGITETEAPKTFEFKFLPRQIADILSEMLDLSLFRDIRFVMIASLSMLVMLAYLVPFAFASVRAETLGIDSSRSSFIIFTLGLSTTIGRPVASAIAQIPRIKALYVHNVCLFVAGCTCLLVPLCTNYISMVVSAFCYGLFMGGHVSLSPIVLVDFLGLAKLTTAYGLLTLVRGISVLTGPPMAGKIYDQTGSYDLAFYLAGALILASAIGFCLLQLKCFLHNGVKKSISS